MPGEAVGTPWGLFHVLQEGVRYRVKHLLIDTGCRTSLHSHRYHREVLTIVKGIAKITVGHRTEVAIEGQLFLIPYSDAHRIENDGANPLEIIEVQIGSNCIEDDITRYEDDYGRPVSARSEARPKRVWPWNVSGYVPEA